MEEIKPAAPKAARRKPVRSRKAVKATEGENLEHNENNNIEIAQETDTAVPSVTEAQVQNQTDQQTQDNTDDAGKKKRQPRQRKHVSKKKPKTQPEVQAETQIAFDVAMEQVAEGVTPTAPIVEAVMVSENQPAVTPANDTVPQVQEAVVSESAVEVVHVPVQNQVKRSMRAERQKALEAQHTHTHTDADPIDQPVELPVAQNAETIVVTVQQEQGGEIMTDDDPAGQQQASRKSRRRRRSRRKKDKNKITAETSPEQIDSENQPEQETQSQPETKADRNDEPKNKRQNRHKDRIKDNNIRQQDDDLEFLDSYSDIDNLNDIYSLDDDDDEIEIIPESRGDDDFIDDDDDEIDDEVADQQKGPQRNIRSKRTQGQTETADGERTGKKHRREMLINISAGQECRIAVVEEGKLEELYVERLDATSLVGNIYKGRIVNIEPSIQACFVDFGIGQNGFLHISDVQTSYFRNSGDHSEKVGKKQPRKERPLIQECLRKGQEVVVQVIKAGIGTKGPTLSTYISIPGRYVVLMPGMSHSGVSRKLSPEDRQKMKELSAELSAPEDVGIILRTASLDSNKRDLKKDFSYLLRLWKQMSHHINNKKSGPMELYKESDLVIRTIRDVFTAGIDRIYCDNENTWNKINDFFAIAMPRSRDLVKLYTDHVPLFTKYNIEREIEKLQTKNVPLPHGGSIVIESTEAMVTIDVNSGKYRDNNNAEDTAYKINLVAADEICRQLKLRDLGGVIVVDFIDMVNNKHKRELEKLMRDLFARDRASTRILRINQFGLMAITRQRMKASLKNRTYTTCPLCKGAGQLKSPESVAIEAMRKIAYAIEEPQVVELDVMLAPQVAAYLLNERRHALVELEQKFSKRITIKSNHDAGPEDIAFDARNGRGIRIDPWL